jgi:phosphoribosylamine---glycine ligase
VRVLVVGGGGREHALCWRLSQSPSIDRLFAAPGNAGTAEVATTVPVAADDVAGLARFAETESIDLTVVGPEVPLVAGLADELEGRGLAVFGPTREAARLEGSKVWARSLCERHGIPVPASRAFDDPSEAEVHLKGLEPPFVVKADGIAAGKGVVVTESRDDAVAAVHAALVERAFGAAGRRVLIEQHLEGEEVSAMALTDGHDVIPLALARDFKRVGDGDTGPNTGGMGAISPVPDVDDGTRRAIVEAVLRPTVRALEAEGVRYRGVLYAGLMLTAGGPQVLEFNCRFGDPEAQAVLPRLVANFPEVLLACVEGNLGPYRLDWTPEACVAVVLASGGYPGPIETGKPIAGLAEAAEVEGVHVFHAGTRRRADGTVQTAGGRVLTVAALGDGLEEARARAYQAASLIRFEGMHHRRDIGIGRPTGAGG